MVRMASVLVLGVAVGFVVGRTTRANRAAPLASTALSALAAAPPASADACGQELRRFARTLRTELIAQMRTELAGWAAPYPSHAAERRPINAASDTAAVDPQDPASTQGALAAYARAAELLDQGLESTRWTQAQADALRDLLPELAADDRAEITRTLAVAINDQRLRLDYVGTPF